MSFRPRGWHEATGFLGVKGAGLAAWPRAVFAQHQAMPVIGYLSSRSLGDSAALVAAFRKGLGEAGFIEGQNVAIEYRWAEGQYDCLPAQAADLARQGVAVLVRGE